MVRRQRHVLALIAVVMLAGVVSLTNVDTGDTRIRTAAEATVLGGGLLGSVGIDVEVALPLPVPAPVLGTRIGDPPPVTTSSTVAPPLVQAVVHVGGSPPASSAVPTPPTTVAATTSTTAVTTTTTRPAATTTSTAPTTTVAPTTTTTVVACHNSTDPACGPFRFDPQPGADSPMTAQVVAGPASVRAGQEAVFTVTLNDPDGVSYGSSVFIFGDSGIGETSQDPCTKFGPWDPPPRDPASATEVQLVRHTYFSPGTYTATFAFEAGPFDCADSVTGRGDRPYASSATGTVIVVVT